MIRNILLILSFATAAAASEPASEATDAPAKPHPVVSVVIEFGQSRQREFPGTIEAEHETVLAFQTIGRIATLTVDVGDTVKGGDVIATLDRVTLQQEVDAAQAALDSAKAEAAYTANTLKRALTLSDRDIATKAQVEEAQAADDAAQAQINAAQADLDSAQEALGYSSLLAPNDGVVLSKSVEIGDVVAAGTQVLTLASMSGRDAVIDVPSEYLSLLTDDAKFEIRAHGPNSRAVVATLRVVEPVADEALRNRRLRLQLTEVPPDFRIGALIGAIYMQDSDPIITLPHTAISETEGDPFVWRVQPGERTVQKVGVTLGKDLGPTIVITDGVNPGDEIVIKGVNSLTDGEKVGERLE